DLLRGVRNDVVQFFGQVLCRRRDILLIVGQLLVLFGRLGLIGVLGDRLFLFRQFGQLLGGFLELGEVIPILLHLGDFIVQFLPRFLESFERLVLLRHGGLSLLLDQVLDRILHRLFGLLQRRLDLFLSR